MSPIALQVIDNLISVLQCIVLVGSVIALFVSLGKFIGKPNQSQNDRLDSLEEWRKKVDARLDTGSDHFESIDEGNTVMQSSQLAILDALISGDNKEELQRQRTELYKYLTKKKGDSL